MAFGKKKQSKSDFDKLSAQEPKDSVRYRDVFEGQQVDRSKLKPRLSMKGRIIFISILAAIVFTLVYVLLSTCQYGVYILFGPSRTQPEASPPAVSQVVGEDSTQAEQGRPAKSAPMDIEYDEFLNEYFVKLPRNPDEGRLVDMYQDSDGTQLDEAGVKALWNEVRAGKHITPEAELWQKVERLKAAHEHGILPFSMAPMNITFADFQRLYFYQSSGGFVTMYYDYDGNSYPDVTELWNKVRNGELGSGEPSDQECIGGNDNTATGGGVDEEEVKFSNFMKPTKGKILISLFFALLTWALAFPFMWRNREAQEAGDDVIDINQYPNDQHVALPAELQLKFDWFPDVGAHSSVQVSSMISHMMLSNKGLKKIKMPRRAAKDIKDEEGNIVYYAGEILLDDNEEPIVDVVPLIDEAFGDALYDASDLPKDKPRTPKDERLRKWFDTTIIAYNKENKNRDKLKGYDTVADMINGDWEMPEYEPQRPAGAYLVDTAPVNTMILAITRAGKGQTVIEPTLDMWTREKQPNNMVINDPKGELLVKFYVRGTVRGFQMVQFNLINPMKTDIYNPLGMAAMAAREGDFTKCALYVENIAEVFFPVDGADDPVWPNAANNAFKRSAYGLIDYYLEEEKELRRRAERTGMNPKVLEAEVDKIWGKVTLYNCYQLFVQLTSKKQKNPTVVFRKRAEAGDFDPPGVDENGNPTPGGSEPLTEEEYNARMEEAKQDGLLWDDKPEADLLTLFFNASAALPNNQMRTLVRNADDSLRAIGGAEKMLSSCELLRVEKTRRRAA